MHERAYRILLRLYPAQFRRSHGDEALQLFRDRLREETGFLRRVRLWLDLLTDFGSIRLRGYHELPAASELAPAGYGIKSVPSFMSLEEEHLRTGALLWGGALSIILCSFVLFALQHGKGRLPHYSEAFHSIREVSKLRAQVRFTYRALNQSKTPEVRLKAVVMPLDGGPVPTGKINFHYGWRTVASGTLVNGELVLDTKLPDDKELALDALYLGDVNYSVANSMEIDPSSHFER